MSSVTKPQGPLPEAVYWRRRILLVAVALVLVVGLGRLLTGGSDAQDGSAAAGDGTATLASTLRKAVPSIDPSPVSSSAATPKSTTTKKTKKSKTGKKSGTKQDGAGSAAQQQPTFAAQPKSACSPGGMRVEPRVADQPAGRDIKVRLMVSTTGDDACLWTVSPDTVTLKITSGSDNIWYSSQCPRAVPSRRVVVGTTKPTKVRMTWDARRSDDGCTSQRLWALPGTYHLEAAALGGEPAQERFLLDTPTPKTITPSPEPKKQKSGSAKTKKQAKKKRQSSDDE